MFVRSVLSTSTCRNQSSSAAGAISLTLLRYSWLVEMKSMSFAYITSQGKLMSAGGRRGRHPRKVRTAGFRYTMESTGDSLSSYGVSTVVLIGSDSASSTLAAMFVSDSRSRTYDSDVVRIKERMRYSGVSFDGLYRTYVIGIYGVFRSCIIGT